MGWLAPDTRRRMQPGFNENMKAKVPLLRCFYVKDFLLVYVGNESLSTSVYEHYPTCVMLV